MRALNACACIGSLTTMRKLSLVAFIVSSCVTACQRDDSGVVALADPKQPPPQQPDASADGPRTTDGPSADSGGQLSDSTSVVDAAPDTYTPMPDALPDAMACPAGQQYQTYCGTENALQDVGRCTPIGTRTAGQACSRTNGVWCVEGLVCIRNHCHHTCDTCPDGPSGCSYDMWWMGHYCQAESSWCATDGVNQ